jgi:acetoin utilization protein AcuB
MLVGERMSRPVITVAPDAPINDVLAMFKKEHIRRAPVIKNSKLVGIITQTDLLNASPSPVTSLSVWEMNYLISKVTVARVMTRRVRVVDVNTPIEEAARIMADYKIGGLPVMNLGRVVGMITETDLFKVFLEMMGARQKATRVTATIPDKRGELAKVTKAIAGAGGNFISFGMFSGPDSTTRLLTFKVEGVSKETIKKVLGKIVKKFWDIRQS